MLTTGIYDILYCPGEGRVYWFALSEFFLLGVCLCVLVSLPHSAMGWFVIMFVAFPF